MTAIEDKEAVLNLRYGPGWDLYRLAVGGWRVTLGRNGKDDVRGGTLEAALTAAVAFVPLPTVPRRPTRVAFFMAERRGNKWCLIVDHAFCAGNLPTKKAAEELGERIKKDRDRVADEWAAKYLATVTNGTEGVDWRWER